MKSIHICHEDPDALPSSEKLLEYTGVNVGNIGHVDWDQRGYQPKMEDISWSTPSVTHRHYTNAWAGHSHGEMVGARLMYREEVAAGKTSLEAIKSVLNAQRKLNESCLGFDNGGLVVAGRAIWILPDEQYAKFHKRAADWVMPTKDYVKSVVNQHYILKDFQEKHNPVVAHVQGVDIRKSDVANGWGAYAGKLMIPEYTRNADGSYLLDEQGNKIPTGREVEGIKINMAEVFKVEAPK